MSYAAAQQLFNNYGHEESRCPFNPFWSNFQVPPPMELYNPLSSTYPENTWKHPVRVVFEYGTKLSFIFLGKAVNSPNGPTRLGGRYVPKICQRPSGSKGSKELEPEPDQVISHPVQFAPCRNRICIILPRYFIFWIDNSVLLTYISYST